MNGPDWLEITILLQGNFTAVFSFGGAVPETPRQGGLPKVAAAPPGPPLQRLFHGWNCRPHFELGSNVVVLLNIEDNQAPHPTLACLHSSIPAQELMRMAYQTRIWPANSHSHYVGREHRLQFLVLANSLAYSIPLNVQIIMAIAIVTTDSNMIL